MRISTIDEVPLQASKWLKSQALIDGQEMRRLFEALGSFHLFLSGILCNRGQEELSRKHFFDRYDAYIESLKAGELPDPSAYRQVFSPVMTKTTDALYAVLMGEDQQLVRVSKPVIQLQAHHMGYSREDGQFRTMVFGSDSIPWGIQFSYPQLYQDNETKDVELTRHSTQFPNTELFHLLQKWMRNNTIPTPFHVNDEVVNVPVRLGKQCLDWINRHPSFAAKGISVEHQR